MTLIFLSDHLALYILLVSCSILSEITFQSLKAEHLHPEETYLNAKTLVQFIVISIPMSTRPSMITSVIYIFNFGLYSFIENCLIKGSEANSMVSPE